MWRSPIKRLDVYVLRNFLGLFLLTLMVCIFILLMQFVWMHVRDLVGKGVELSVLAEFFIYAVASVVPLALPPALTSQRSGQACFSCARFWISIRPSG